MKPEKPQCLYCGSLNLERQAYRIGYECLDCHKFMGDLCHYWSFLEKGKIRNDLTGNIAVLSADGDSFTVEDRKVIW